MLLIFWLLQASAVAYSQGHGFGKCSLAYHSQFAHYFCDLIIRSCLAAANSFSSVSISCDHTCSGGSTSPTKVVVTHLGLPGFPYLDSISNSSSWAAGDGVLIPSLILAAGNYSFMVIHTRSHMMVWVPVVLLLKMKEITFCLFSFIWIFLLQVSHTLVLPLLLKALNLYLKTFSSSSSKCPYTPG